jgi:hypothetical protein
MILLNSSTVEILRPNAEITMSYLKKFVKVWKHRLHVRDPHGQIGCSYVGFIHNYHVLKIRIQSSDKQMGQIFAYLDCDYTTETCDGKYYFEYLTGISKTRETKKTMITIRD